MRDKLGVIIPGMLIAATGVGAGDLATASLAGSQLGVAALWAVVVGGVFKYVLTEGLARWQLVNGLTFIEGLCHRLGPIFVWGFLIYIVLWSFFVGSALISACGIALHALFPVFDGESDKVLFGVASSLTGLALVRLGGFKLFEWAMSVSIGLMFLIVLVTAVLLWPGTEQVISGLFLPRIPKADSGGITWTIALIGGVGGTLTIFCYGYWIEEKNRNNISDVATCRVDLALAYTMTIIFGMAMVVIGSTISVEGKGAGLLVKLAVSLESALGQQAKLLFLAGAFFAIFSSLMGVWQAVPYLFADVFRYGLRGEADATKSSSLKATKSYRIYQVLLAVVPIAGLFVSFKEIQKLYAVIGTLFMPFLAMALIIFCNQSTMRKHKNGWVINALLASTFLFFSYMAWLKFFNG